MPQFDKFSFLSQLCWVFLSFGLLYLFLNYFLLPAISAILKVRKSKLTHTLFRVEQKSALTSFGCGLVHVIYKNFIFRSLFFSSEARSSFKVLASLARTRSSSFAQKALGKFNASFFQTVINVLTAAGTEPKR